MFVGFFGLGSMMGTAAMGGKVGLSLGGGGMMGYTEPLMGGVARGVSPAGKVLSWSLPAHPSGIKQASNVAVGSGAAEMVLSYSLPAQWLGSTQASTSIVVDAGSGATGTALSSGLPAQSLGITQASIGPVVVAAGSGAAVTVVPTAARGAAAAVAASMANAAVLIFILISLDRFADAVVSNKEDRQGVPASESWSR